MRRGFCYDGLAVTGMLVARNKGVKKMPTSSFDKSEYEERGQQQMREFMARRQAEEDEARKFEDSRSTSWVPACELSDDMDSFIQGYEACPFKEE
jgi:hypothetical protein